MATQLADGRTSRPPTPEQKAAWQAAYREVAAAAIADILRAVETKPAAKGKRAA